MLFIAVPYPSLLEDLKEVLCVKDLYSVLFLFSLNNLVIYRTFKEFVECDAQVKQGHHELCQNLY